MVAEEGEFGSGSTCSFGNALRIALDFYGTSPLTGDAETGIVYHVHDEGVGVVGVVLGADVTLCGGCITVHHKVAAGNEVEVEG